MRTNIRPTFKFASSVEIKRTFVEYPAAFAWSSSCVFTNVFDGKGTPLLKKRLLLVSQRGNKCWEWLFQVGFIESCLTGAHWSRDYEQRWLLTRVDRNQQKSTNIARKSTKVGRNRQKSSVVNRSQHFFNGNRSAVQGMLGNHRRKTHVLEHKGLWRRCSYFYRQVLIFQKEEMWRLLHQMWHKCAIADSSTFPRLFDSLDGRKYMAKPRI